MKCAGPCCVDLLLRIPVSPESLVFAFQGVDTLWCYMSRVQSSFFFSRLTTCHATRNKGSRAQSTGNARKHEGHICSDDKSLGKSLGAERQPVSPVEWTPRYSPMNQDRMVALIAGQGLGLASSQELVADRKTQ